MYEFLLWLFRLTVYTSVTAVILLLLKRILRDRLPPLLHYALWGILLIRIVFPVLPESPLSVFNFFSERGQQMEEIVFGDKLHLAEEQEPSEAFIEKLLEQEAAQIHAAEMGIDVSLYETEQQQMYLRQKEQKLLAERLLGSIVIVYAVGAVLHFIWLWLSYRQIRRLAARSAIPCRDPSVLQRYAQIVRHLRIKENKAPRLYWGETSMLCGIVRPVLLVDKRTDPADIPMVLVHELHHYRQRDNLVLLLSHILVCVMWFNPLVRLSRNILRDDLEILCDSRTLQIPSVNPGRYAKLLYVSTDSACRFSMAASYMSAEGSFLKHRLLRIAEKKKYSTGVRFLSLLLCVITVFACLTDPVQSLSDEYEVYMVTGENLSGELCADADPRDGISGVRFYNMVYSTLRNRTGGDHSPLIDTLGDGSLRSFIRKTVDSGKSFEGFGEFMMDFAAAQNITWEQAAILLETIVHVASDSVFTGELMPIPQQIREETLAQVLQNLSEEEAVALLHCYNRGSAESDIRFDDCYSVETIVRILQCIENEWLRMKFMSCYYPCSRDKLPDSMTLSDSAEPSNYGYVFLLQSDISLREERTLGEILAITRSGQREDVFYLKPREDLYSYEDASYLYEKAGFDLRDRQEEYAALGFSERDGSVPGISWSIVDPDVHLSGDPLYPHGAYSAKSVCALGFMEENEDGSFPYQQSLTFGEAMHILCLLYAGMHS